ncbi:EexN family lipoprotein [Methylocystis sp. B8]|uniref:EexN family lipoprotein n=1 Tax=Methylocystis sp. B8 TaxID=544938 RepID=UPI00148588DA|nr:EexN family lipoprotein [Methylocystis sp. B8]
MKRSLLVFGSLVILAACGDKANDKSPSRSTSPQPPKARTVLEFLENPEALDEAWARCRNDPGGLGATGECVNAGYAKERLMMLGRERAIQSLKR